MILGNMSSALNEIGIETEIRNDILGGAIGEISPGETWIELWVVRKTQAEAATARIKEILEQPERDDWLCNQCVDLHLKLTQDLHLILTHPGRQIMA